MTQRLDDIDSLMARMEKAFGVNASQVVWLYDGQVDLDALRRFGGRLQHGMLGRVVAPAALGAAGDRWTKAPRPAPIVVEAEPIPRDRLESWLAEQSRAAIDSYGGPAWRLSTVGLDDGGSVVSLLVSHVVADGLLLLRSIGDAVHGREHPYQAHDRENRLVRGVCEIRDAFRQTLCALQFRIELARRDRATTESPRPSADVEPAATASVALPADFELPRATAVVDASAWRAAASARGGTATVLAVAVAAELAAALGRTTKTGDVQIRMPVSTRRDDTDDRANAVRGVVLDACRRIDPATDLTSLRSQLKEVLQEDPDGTRHPHAALLALHRMVPRRRLARIMANSKVADYLGTVVTVIGAPDPAVLRIDGTDAVAMAGSLINRTAERPDRLGTCGGSFSMTVLTVGDSVTLRVSAFHPPDPRTRVELAGAFEMVLARFGLTATFW